MNKVHFWADSIWCWPSELEEYLAGRSDDYSTIEVDEHLDEDEIDTLVGSIAAI